MKRAVKIKIENNHLRETIDQYFKAYCFCIEKGMELRTSNKKKVHNATYQELRKIYPELPSALLQTVRDVACENLKAVKLKTKPVAKNKFIRFDKRTFSFKDGKVSVSTVNGRNKFQINIPKHFHKYLDWECKASTLILRNNQLWLNLIFNKETKLNKPEIVLGIDRGINNIAVCSDNNFYNSKQLKNVKGKYQYLKATLQSIGTSSAKRHLKKLSGREKRFVRDVNHCISKQIVNKNYDSFALEDLKKLPINKGKRFNKKLGNWSYHQLGNFVGYKAEELEKTIIKVNPRYTSQTCSKCGNAERSNRNGNLFKCGKCNFQLNADLNASRNIANSGISQISRLSVIQPLVAAEIPVTSLHNLEVGR